MQIRKGIYQFVYESLFESQHLTRVLIPAFYQDRVRIDLPGLHLPV